MVDYHCMLDCKFFEDRSTDGITDGYCKKYNQSLVFYDWWEKCNGCYRETLRKAYYSTKTNDDNDKADLLELEGSIYDIEK